MNVFYQENAKRDAKHLVERCHYSHLMPNSVYCASWHLPGGLFGTRGRIVAAASFAPPVAYHDSLFATAPMLELKRLVRDNELPCPPLSGLIAKACRRIKELGLAELLISYADLDEDHHGGVYQACSWFYNGARAPSYGYYLIVNGDKVSTRGLKAAFGTANADRLQEMMPSASIERYQDRGKHLYWRPLTKKGRKIAEELKFVALPYPKPEAQEGKVVGGTY